MSTLTRNEVEGWPALGPMSMKADRVLGLLDELDDMRAELALTRAALANAEAQRDACAAEAVTLRAALTEKARGPWYAVPCVRADGTLIGTFNVVRVQAETWVDSRGLRRPFFDHHGDGGYTQQQAEEHVAALNIETAALSAPSTAAATLREFGLRVAVAVHENEGDGTIAGSLPELVDAVLRGER